MAGVDTRRPSMPEGTTPPGVDVDELVVRYLDGALSADEEATLSQQLARDPKLRKRFVDTCMQAALLHEGAAGRLAQTPPSAGWRSWRKRSVGIVSTVAVAAAAAFLIFRAPESRVPGGR